MSIDSTTAARPCLAFLLDAPMQSWGTTSRFQRRGTNHHPSKSALAGMIAAAMGLEKGTDAERETLAAIAELRVITVVLPRTDRRGKSLPMQRLRDYHTVGGGFDRKSDPQSIPRKAKGGPGDNATVTEREYLTDTRFSVMLEAREGDTSLLERIRLALLDPVWGVWFGRKCCLPGRPLSPRLTDSRDAAFAAMLTTAGFEGRDIAEFEREEEVDNPVEADAAFDDQPVSFGTGKTSGADGRAFRLRGVRLYRAQIKE
ncbi:MAG TPA: type I-E CRISPR-associated protein Cas5/CasD [Methylomirabilota bacterium]|nr:type I-E CRISPR-associated protein Cas5/CasD [Methylomirabilota bacterium]